jgi:hypothetical protein
LKILVAVLITLLFYVGGCTDSEDSTMPTEPPTGPGISSQLRPVDISEQLISIGFVGPDQNDTGKWLRPADGTTAVIEPDHVTATFQRADGAVTCVIPDDEQHFMDMFMQMERKDRTALVNEHDCS